MTDDFTFAHLTDAHLPSHGGFAAGELTGKRALSALNWALHRRERHDRGVADALSADVLRFAPDHVAMTGDVVNFGLERECRAGAEWLAGFGGAERLSYVPGNHESLHRDCERHWRAAFAPFAPGGDWPFARRFGDVAFIGVSTSIPTPPGYAQGEVGAAQREAMKALLSERRGAFRVLLIHHPPTNMTKPSKSLRDRRAVSAAIAEAGADLILHGHDHRNEMSWIDRADGCRIPVLGAPSASTPFGHGEAAEWRLISVAREAGDWRISVRRRAIGPDGAFADVGRFAFRVPVQADFSA
ncbi:MAG: metallophosphoesterase [Pseudomonadota bacterium]